MSPNQYAQCSKSVSYDISLRIQRIGISSCSYIFATTVYIKVPADIRSKMSLLQKRGPPSEVPEGTKPPGTKRTKSAHSNKEDTKGAKSVISDQKDQVFTEDECYWIRFHHYQLNFAVSNRLRTAPEGTISCAYFNAYHQIYPIDQTDGENPRPNHPLRPYRVYQRKAEQIFPNLIPQILKGSARNQLTHGVREFRPIITSSCLLSFRTIFDKYSHNGEFNYGDAAGVAEMNEFLGNVADQQLAPYQPTWLADGAASISRRSRIDLAGYTSHHLGELDYSPSSQRSIWHQQHQAPTRPQQYTTVSHEPREPHKKVLMVHRAVHADVGNALLNMADERPREYDRALKEQIRNPANAELAEKIQKEHKEFNYNVKALKAGDRLRKRVFDEAVWPPVASSMDTAARPVFVRKPALFASEE
jgi:hypothetical protein